MTSGNQLSAEEISRAAGRIFRSKPFARAERMPRLLICAIEWKLAGRDFGD